MAKKVRTPLFLVIALIVGVLVIGVEMGSSYRASASMFAGVTGRGRQMKDAIGRFGKSGSKKNNSSVKGMKGLEKVLSMNPEKSPGFGIASLQYVDLLLLFTLFMTALPLVIKAKVVAQTQGILTIIVSFLTIVFGLLFIVKVLIHLMIMIAFMLAIPFGTIIYMIKWGFFETRKAAAIMSTLMTLKIAIAVLMLVAHEKFLKNIGLILIIGTSLITMIILSFLHNFLPVFLVSITDAIGAIVNTIIAIIWSILLLISGIISLIKLILGLDKVFK